MFPFPLGPDVVRVGALSFVAGVLISTRNFGTLFEGRGTPIFNMLELPQNAKTRPPTFGPCPKRNEPLRLSLIEPVSSTHDQRVYECLSCGHSETGTMKYR